MSTVRQLAQSCLCSQWVDGEENLVSDCFSCDFHLPDENLTLVTKSFIPSQVPFGLTINPLPKEIVLWLTNLLQNLLKKIQGLKQPMQSKLLLPSGQLERPKTQPR
jgi:hypothetical protein